MVSAGGILLRSELDVSVNKVIVIDGAFHVKVFDYSMGPHCIKVFGEVNSMRDGEAAPGDLTLLSRRGRRRDQVSKVGDRTGGK